MLRPADDLEARAPIWDQMQMFWMDTDPAFEIEETARVCATSKYSIEELKQIFLNEVRPAVSFNLYSGLAPEWTGFELKWLSDRILKTHRHGRRLPFKILNSYAYSWWAKLEVAIEKERQRVSIA